MQWVSFFSNANNLEYEIEVRFAHHGEFHEGYGWDCCISKNLLSICRCEGNALSTKHFGVYHAGKEGKSHVNTQYPYCYHEKGSCNQKPHWTCCDLPNFEEATCPGNRKSLVYKQMLMMFFNHP